MVVRSMCLFVTWLSFWSAYLLCKELMTKTGPSILTKVVEDAPQHGFPINTKIDFTPLLEAYDWKTVVEPFIKGMGERSW